MQLDSVTAEIRPRSDWEAVDLGFAMVRRDFWRCYVVWWVALLLPTVVAVWALWNQPFLLLCLFWWMKPLGSRMVLFELSRRLFGEQPTWRQSLAQVPKAWTRRFIYRFFVARWSPWFYVTMAVEDLEGLRGKLYQQRCRQLSRRGESPVMWIYFISDFAAIWLGVGLVILLMLLLPQGQEGIWSQAVDSWDPGFPTEIPLLILRVTVLCVMMAMSLSDGFVTGAGFGLYLNNRTWLEGWDVELAFKRMAKRLAGAVLVIFCCFISSPVAHGDTSRPPAEVIREVKAHPDFKVHTVTEKVPVQNDAVDFDWMPKDLAKAFLTIFAYGCVALLLGLLVWAIWKNRHVFGVRNRPQRVPQSEARTRIVMGLEISPDTLPDDVPNAAWALWMEGRHHEALGLLYRGAISRVIELGQVEIQESDTEGDCMRRVAQAGIQPDYFRSITGQWMGLAYAGKIPSGSDVQALCLQWPFGERRPK